MTSLLRIILVFSLVWTISRTAVYLLPGDPAEFLVHESLVQTTPELLRSKMDLNESGWKRVFSLPSTQSLIKKEPASRLVWNGLVNSFELTLIALLLSSLFTGSALFLGFRSPKLKKTIAYLVSIIASLPVFVSGPLLLLLFCVQLKWMTPMESPFLPALTLSFYLTSFWFRTLEQKMDAYLPVSSVMGARARGVSENIIFSKYLFAPVIGYFLAYLGTQIGILLNGSLLVEIIFQWNGIGSLLADSVMSRDYPVIEMSLGAVTLIALLSQQFGYFLQQLWDPKQS